MGRVRAPAKGFIPRRLHGRYWEHQYRRRSHTPVAQNRALEASRHLFLHYKGPRVTGLSHPVNSFVISGLGADTIFCGCASDASDVDAALPVLLSRLEQHRNLRASSRAGSEL